MKIRTKILDAVFVIQRAKVRKILDIRKCLCIFLCTCSVLSTAKVTKYFLEKT